MIYTHCLVVSIAPQENSIECHAHGFGKDCPRRLS